MGRQLQPGEMKIARERAKVEKERFFFAGHRALCRCRENAERKIWRLCNRKEVEGPRTVILFKNGHARGSVHMRCPYFV